MVQRKGVAATMMGALAKANVNIKAIAQGSSEYNITILIDQRDSERALRAVHSRFYLSDVPIGVGIVGPGLIGGTFVDQIRDQVRRGRAYGGCLTKVMRARGACVALHCIAVQDSKQDPTVSCWVCSCLPGMCGTTQC